MAALAVLLKKTEDTNYNFNYSNLSLYWFHKNELARGLVEVNTSFYFWKQR